MATCPEQLSIPDYKSEPLDHSWPQKRAHVDVTSAEETDNRVKESVHETIKKRGEGLTEATSDKTTDAKVEFKLTNSVTQFNVRSALGNLLELMKLVDKHVFLQSTSDETQ